MRVAFANPRHLDKGKRNDKLYYESQLKFKITVFENHRKRLIQYCERSEQRLHFELTKVKRCYQKGQKLVKNVKIEKLKEMRHFC